MNTHCYNRIDHSSPAHPAAESARGAHGGKSGTHSAGGIPPRSCWSLLLLPLAAALTLATAAGAIVLIEPNGTGTYPTIQEAINAVPNGTIIYLDDGTFTGTGNRDLQFMGKAITVESQSGNPTTCIIDAQGTGRAFWFWRGESSQALVQGVTIQGGYVEVAGGGIFCDGASPTINNCHITRNHVTSSHLIAAGCGGGIACIHGSAPTITDCLISYCDCQSTEGYSYGGGLYSDASSTPTLRNCTVSSNETSGYRTSAGGGGIACTAAQIVGCTINSNTASAEDPFHSGLGDGGGILCNGAFISGCTIKGNFSGHDGGVGGGSNTTIMGSVISGNAAHEGAGGLGGNNLTVISCTIAGNNVTSGFGGIDGSATLTNTILWGNCSSIGPDGGGELTFICCDVNPAQLDQSGTYVFTGPQVNADPLFCSPVSCSNAPTTAGDYTLHGNSPCLPSASPCGLLIGALDQDCPGPVPTKNMSWGQIKASFKGSSR